MSKKYTLEEYNQIMEDVRQIMKEEGGDQLTILKNRFPDFNRYEHYYGYNKPID